MTRSWGSEASRLGRLYLYSKDTEFAAQENFTTEALALAVMDDPRPMIRALQDLARQYSCPFALNRAGSLRPKTQQYLVGGGFLDLVLEVGDADATVLGEVWIEVKVAAVESGDQLAGYARVAGIRNGRGGRPTWLITLGKSPLREYVPHLSWAAFYQVIRRTPDEHESWSDLRRFLEEQSVASDALGLITDREAAAIEGAFDAFQKASEVIRAVHRRLEDVFAPEVAAQVRWRAEGEMVNTAAANFIRNREFAGIGGPLVYGLTSADGIATWFVALRLYPATTEAADAVRRAADTAGLSSEVWQRPSAGQTILVSHVRAAVNGTHAEAVEWIVDRLRELSSAGVANVALGMAPDLAEHVAGAALGQADVDDDGAIERPAPTSD